MRRIICVILSLVSLFSLFACSQVTNNEVTPEPSQYAQISPEPITIEPVVTEPPATPEITVEPTATPEPTPEPTATPEPTPEPSHTPKPTPYCNPFPTSDAEIKRANAGKRFMEKLKATEGYEDLNLKAKYGFPYLICVNNINSCVTVFCVDENGYYTRPYLSMVCSGGVDTPEGIFKTPARYSWHVLMGPCYGQYCTRIVRGVLFHSVPYYTPHKYDLQYRSFNRLGWIISHGCIRLAVNDAKWIYDNCPIGTTVVIYNDRSSVGPMSRPYPIRIDASNLFRRGWDPTDPDDANPYGDEYKMGSTLRSELAWEDYYYAIENGLWDDSINPPERPTATPDFTPTPAPTDTPEPTEVPSETPTPMPTETPVVDTPTPVPTITPTPTPTPTMVPTPSPEPTVTPDPKITPTPNP